MNAAPAGAIPPYPRVSPCRHCGLAVLRDNDGRWIHASLSYACRDRWGAVTATAAEPTPPATGQITASWPSGAPSTWWAVGSERSVPDKPGRFTIDG